MEQFVFLAGWMGSGVATSAWAARADASTWTWAPIAAVLGPLWAAVALDQRDAATSTPSHDLHDSFEPPSGMPVGYADAWTHPERQPSSGPSTSR